MDSDVERFKRLTRASSQTARFCLQSCNGNFDDAVLMYHNTPELQAMDPQERQPGGLINGLTRLVTTVLTSPYRGLQALAEQAVKPMDETLQADAFVRSFRNDYGPHHPTFVEMGWKDAVRQAERQSRLLFVYLHAPDHEETENFCRHVLSNNQVTTFLDHNFVCWGGTVHQPSAYKLASDAGVTTYPSVCLLGCNGTRERIILSIQRKIAGGELINILQRCLDEQGSVLMAQRAERHQREMDRQLRQDQDREYQRALEADRERDRRNREAAAVRAAVEEERRRKTEQARLAAEAIEKQAQARQQAIVRRQREKAAALKPEPSGSVHKIVQLRVRLPDGSTHTRKFLESSQVSLFLRGHECGCEVEDVYDYVDGLEGLHCWEYTLASSYPRIDFGTETREKTLIEMGVEHSATLLVQSHDD